MRIKRNHSIRFQELQPQAQAEVEKEVGKRTAALMKAKAQAELELERCRQLEKRLLESEEKYRTLFQESPISLWEEDCSALRRYIARLAKQGISDFRQYFAGHPKAVRSCIAKIKAVDTNTTSVALYQAESREQLLNQSRWRFSEESLDSFREGIVAYAEGKNSFESEAVVQTLAGETRHFFVKWSVVSGHRGERTRLITSQVDITVLRRAESELRKFKIISDASEVGSAIADLNGHFIYVNNAFASMYGYEVEEIVGKHYSDLVTGEQRRYIQHLGKVLMKTGSLRNAEFKHLRKDKTTFPALTNAKIITDAKGRKLYVASSTVDISDRRHAERSLRRQEQELQEKTAALEETNSALRFLMRNQQARTGEIESDLKNGLKQLLVPILDRLKKISNSDDQKTCIDVLQETLDAFVRPASSLLPFKYPGLTQTEIQVANLVRDGKDSGEIARLLSIAPRTVHTHRYNIRLKLSIANQKVNLRTFLLSLDQ